MSKVRVYEIAKQLGIDEQAALTLLQSQGAPVRNRLSAVDADIVDRARRALERSKSASVVEERIRPTVVRRKATPKPVPEPVAETPVSAPLGVRRTNGHPIEPVASGTREHHREPSPPQGDARVAEARGATELGGRTVGDISESAPQSAVVRGHLEPEIGREPTHVPRGLEVDARAAVSATVEDAGARPAEVPLATVPEPVSIAHAAVASSLHDDHLAPAAVAPHDVLRETEVAGGGSDSHPPVVHSDPANLRSGAPLGVPVRDEIPLVGLQTSVAAADDNPIESPGVGASLIAEPVPVVAEEWEPNNAAEPVVLAVLETGVPVPPLPAPPGRSATPKTGIETWAGRPGVPMPQPVQSRGTGPRPGPPGLGSGPGGTMQRRGVQYDPRRDASPPGRPGMGGGPPARPGTPGNRPGMAARGSVGGASGSRGRGGMSGPSTIRRPTAPPTTAEMSAHKKIIKIDEKVTLNTLAGKMSLKATDVLMKLLGMGMTGVNINTTLDADTAKILASEFGWEVSDVAVSEADVLKEARGEEVATVTGELEWRPPVVTVMGHVDHGKTSLLDRIRHAEVAAGEAGGITQHIGAYKVTTPRGQITFLDTPGHEAFTQMRARGASVTDIVVLVVAADDGVMPQTREAVNHAKAARVPIVVAVNKVDKPEADPARPRRELMEMELVPEELGGETMFIDVSAKTGIGIEQLLEALTLQAEVLELKANPKKPAHGTVIEALLDRGKGPVARILVRDGTLSVGDVIIAGPAWGKVRAMTDEHGRPVLKAGPSTPVEILGLSDVPNAGDPVDMVRDSRKAQELAETRGAKQKKINMPATAKVSLEDLAKRVAESGQLELRLIIKGDVQGSVEAVTDALQKLSGEKVRVNVVHSAVGAITEGDVNLAAASKAIIVGFSVRPAGKAAALADSEGVEIRLYNIIYNAVDDVKKAMEGLLAPTLIEKFVGRAEVRQVFNISKVGTVAGSMVIDGTIKRAASKVRLLRDSAMIWEGKIAGLKHIKEDRKEVEKGFECGISLDGYNDVKMLDIIECFDVEQVAATL